MGRYPQSYLSLARSKDADGNPYLNLKEIIMNDELELEIIDLGDAKEETKGGKTGPLAESDPVNHFRPE